MSPREDWKWHGMGGHFIAIRRCCFHLHTTIGDYRISTVGCYHPATGDQGNPHPIGLDRLYETMVFVNGPDGEPGDWSEIDGDGYNDEAAADAGHFAMCEKYAAL